MSDEDVKPNAENGIPLKGGFFATDPRLGRIPEFDERSRNYNIRKLFTVEEHTTPRSYTWTCPVWLDQGDTPACVGFAWSQELAARPVKVQGITNESAQELYHSAQMLDEWPGENYDGSSTLGGVKAAVKLGKIEEYRWAFNTMDLAIAVSWFGPAVVGINWYNKMFNPVFIGDDAMPWLQIGGGLAGGHDILVIAYNVKKNAFKMHNSWGSAWGLSGEAWISFADLDRLLHENGDACIPVIRVK